MTRYATQCEEIRQKKKLKN